MSVVTHEQDDLLPALSAGRLAAGEVGNQSATAPSCGLGSWHQRCIGAGVPGGTQLFLFALRRLLAGFTLERYCCAPWVPWFTDLRSRWQRFVWLELPGGSSISDPHLHDQSCCTMALPAARCLLPIALCRLDPYFVCTGCLLKDVPV